MSRHSFSSSPPPDDTVAAGYSPLSSVPAYRLAYEDMDFIMQESLRPIRLQLEMLKPEMAQQKFGVESTIVVFGSARILPEDEAAQHVREAEQALIAAPDDPVLVRKRAVARRLLSTSRYYEEARRFGHLVTQATGQGSPYTYVITTGGGPGIMEAANRGAAEAGGPTVGLNIVLPHEQAPNPYITPDLCFNFHYFALRKMHFMVRVKALVVFPGGFGTLDELFEALTLLQTRKISPIPILMFGAEYWSRVLNFQAMVDEGMIDKEDVDLVTFVETAEDAWSVIAKHYGLMEKTTVA